MFEKMKLPVVKIVFLCLLAVYALLTVTWTFASRIQWYGSNAGTIIGCILNLIVVLALFGLTIFTTATGLKNYSNFLLAALFVYFLVSYLMSYGLALCSLDGESGYFITAAVFSFFFSTIMVIVAVLQTLDYNIVAIDFTKLTLILLLAGIGCGIMIFLFDTIAYAQNNYAWYNYLSSINENLILPSALFFGFLFYKRSNPKIHSA